MTQLAVFLDVQRLPCLVVGGGPVGLRRARALAEAGAQVTLVAPRIQRAVSALPHLTVVRRRYRPRDLAQFNPKLVVAATDDPRINARIADQAKARGLWVNVASRASQGNLIFPATVSQGTVTLAVSTGGKSP